MDIGKYRNEVLPWFEGYLRILEVPPDFAAGHRLVNLTDLARRYVQRKKQEAMNRLDE
ncbi:MAG: hypothetical protein P8Y45_19115 [Exilibacterium sp.]